MLLVAGDFDGSSRFGLRQSPCLSFRGGNVLCICCDSTDGTGRTETEVQVEQCRRGASRGGY